MTSTISKKEPEGKRSERKNSTKSICILTLSDKDGTREGQSLKQNFFYENKN